MRHAPIATSHRRALKSLPNGGMPLHANVQSVISEPPLGQRYATPSPGYLARPTRATIPHIWWGWGQKTLLQRNQRHQAKQGGSTSRYGIPGENAAQTSGQPSGANKNTLPTQPRRHVPPGWRETCCRTMDDNADREHRTHNIKRFCRIK